MTAAWGMTAPVVVGLAERLWLPVMTDGQRIQSRIAAGLIELGAQLGVPAPEVTIRRDEATDPGLPVRILVDGRLCPFGVHLVLEAVSYVGSPTGRDFNPRCLDELLAELPHDDLAEALTLVVRGAVTAYAALLVPEGSSAAVLLDLGVSLAGLDETAELRQPASAATDALLVRALRQSIDIVVARSCVEQLTAATADPELFSYLRGSLFDELGIEVPKLHLRVDPELPPDCFSFVVNGVDTMPRRGPAPGTFFVNGFPTALQELGLAAVPLAYSGAAKPGSIVTATSRGEIEALGYTVWDLAQFLLLALAAVLRASAPAFVTAERARRLLEDAATYLPTLGKAAQSLIEPELLAAVLRGLLRDGISVRNLTLILQALLEYQDLGSDTDDAVLEFVRHRMAAQISAKAARGGDTVVAYLSGQAFTDAVAAYAAAPGSAAAETAAQLLYTAVRRALDELPPTVFTPAVLVRSAERPRVAAVLRRAFPDVIVVGYRDLLPEISVQPIDRIDVEPAGVPTS